MKRIALYCRVSTKDTKQTTENQQQQLKQFVASQNGWTVTHEYLDYASGGRSDREQLNRMFLAASQHQFDMLLFWSLDRLSREGVVETLNYLQRLNQYHVEYRSYTEAYLDSCGIFKDAVISILSTVAKQEKIRLSERIHAGLQRSRAAGRIGGRRPVGNDIRERVLALRASGASLSSIAASTGISKMSASRIVRTE